MSLTPTENGVEPEDEEGQDLIWGVTSFGRHTPINCWDCKLYSHREFKTEFEKEARKKITRSYHNDEADEFGKLIELDPDKGEEQKPFIVFKKV